MAHAEKLSKMVKQSVELVLVVVVVSELKR